MRRLLFLIPLLLMTTTCASNVRIARKLLNEGRRGEARELLDQELTEHPDRGQALLLRGVIAMQEHDFIAAHDYFDRAGERSLDLRREIESTWGPMLEHLESIVWVEVCPEPSLFARRIAVLPGPIEADRIEDQLPGWTRFLLQLWHPNDEYMTQYRHSPCVEVLFETPEMLFVEFNAWANSDQVRLRDRQPLGQGVQLVIEYLNHVPTRDGKVLVFGEVTNRGTATAVNPRAVIQVLALNLGLDTMGYSTAMGDPMGAMPPAVQEYLMRNMVVSSTATVPVRPNRLAPGETGVIVLTVESQGSASRMFFNAQMEWDR